MAEQGMTGNSSLAQQTSRILSGTRQGGAGNGMQAGQALAARAGRVTGGGNATAFNRAPSAGAANRGSTYSQVPGQAARRGVQVSATAVTTTEGESGGQHDAAQFTYTVVPWNQNAAEGMDTNNQTHLEPGDPVFVQSLSVERYQLYNLINVAQLNTALADNTVVFMARVAKRIPEAVKFNNFLQTYGDRWLNIYIYHRDTNSLRHLRALFESIGDAEEMLSQLKEMAQMAIQKDYYSLTKYGIRHHWNFVGFVLNTSDPLRIRGIQQLGYSRVLSVNVTVKGNFEAALQIWPGLKQCPARSKLYFVLTRVSTEDGSTPFQFVPWGSRTRESVPLSLLQYYDDAGHLSDGDSIYVGVVHLPPNRDAPDSMRLLAAGLIRETPHVQREAGAKLTRDNGQMRIQIGIH